MGRFCSLIKIPVVYSMYDYRPQAFANIAFIKYRLAKLVERAAKVIWGEQACPSRSPTATESGTPVRPRLFEPAQRALTRAAHLCSIYL